MDTEHIVTKLSQLKDTYIETAKTMFTKGVAQLFDEHPELDSFGFVAYSPYFNDGDECVFNIYSDIDYGLYINGYENEIESEHGEGGQKEFEPRQKDNYIWNRITRYDYSNGFNNRTLIDGELPIDNMVKAVSNFINSFPLDIWEELIGNHVMVRISRDGIETTEYSEHD